MPKRLTKERCRAGAGVGWGDLTLEAVLTFQASPKSPCDPLYPLGTLPSLSFSFVVVLIFFKTLNVLKFIIKVS